MKKRHRCGWCDENSELYKQYHDTEWGVPLTDDHKLFELLILEGMQAGLSWLTILKKRENFTKALAGFDYEVIARFEDKDIESLLANEGIIRNRLKLEAVVKNARAFLDLRREYGSFARYLWQYVDFRPLQNSFAALSDIPAKTDLSIRISRDLKKRGMNFVGPTIIYAFMQAVGMVNDHETGCFRYAECAGMAENVDDRINAQCRS